MRVCEGARVLVVRGVGVRGDRREGSAVRLARGGGKARGVVPCLLCVRVELHISHQLARGELFSR